MNDPEKPLRDAICKTLTALGTCEQSVAIRPRDLSFSKNGRLEADVLVTPHDPAFAHFPFAIEAKIKPQVEDRSLGDWIMQAHSYVGGQRLDRAAPPISAAFLWLVDKSWKPNETATIQQMLMLAQHLQVGTVQRDDRGHLRIGFTGGMDIVWVDGKGWMPQALTLLQRPPLWFRRR